MCPESRDPEQFLLSLMFFKMYVSFEFSIVYLWRPPISQADVLCFFLKPLLHWAHAVYPAIHELKSHIRVTKRGRTQLKMSELIDK